MKISIENEEHQENHRKWKQIENEEHHDNHRKTESKNEDNYKKWRTSGKS